MDFRRIAAQRLELPRVHALDDVEVPAADGDFCPPVRQTRRRVFLLGVGGPLFEDFGATSAPDDEDADFR